jgi:hypothetical protein
LTWLTFIILFPVAIIDGIAYNSHDLNKLNKQRKLSYNGLYLSIHDEISQIFETQLEYFLSHYQEKNSNDMVEDILGNYYTEAALIDSKYYHLMKGYKNNLSFPLQYKKNHTIDTIFPPLINIVKYEEEYYDEFALSILKKNIENFRAKFYAATDEHIDTIFDDIKHNYKMLIEKPEVLSDELYVSSLSDYITDIGNAVDKSSDFFVLLLSQCLYQNNASIKINILNNTIDFIYPLMLDVYVINGFNYHAKSYDEMNEYISYILGDWENQHTLIIEKIITAKTNEIVHSLENYSYYSENQIIALIESIGYNYYYEMANGNYIKYYFEQCKTSNKFINTIDLNNIDFYDSSLLPISITKIEDSYFDETAVNELQKSMAIISECLIDISKEILINGISKQNEILTRNAIDYVNWYYSSFTRIDKTITNFFGFLAGEKNTEEKYMNTNFHRIMSKEADFNEIINHDMLNHINNINLIGVDYIAILEYFKIDMVQDYENNLTIDDYILFYIKNIIEYFEQLDEAFQYVNDFYFSDYNIEDNKIIKTVKASTKLLSSVGFFSGFLVDYIALKSQQLLNSDTLKEQILNRLKEIQSRKIAAIYNPFGFLHDTLQIGSILFVGNYFIGLSTYQHYGVYIGDNKVIHFAPYEGEEISPENGIIHETSLEKFLNGRELQIAQDIDSKYSEGEIINRANSRIGEKGYDLLTNNCEHFARWCVTGENVSYQIDNLPSKIDTTLLSIKENYNTFTKFLELFD